MNNLQFLNPNKISKTAVDYSRFPDIMFLAESEGECFTDVNIVTSAAYRKDKAIELAFLYGADISSVEQKAKQLSATLPLEQFVEIFEENVLVVIDVHVIDDNVINKAFIMLSQVTEFKVGERITFNEPKSHH